MITLSSLLIAAACITLVSSQLALAQHTALMELYNSLGVAPVTEFFFLFFLFPTLSSSLPLRKGVLLHCVRALRRLNRALAVL
jgi:hypothetical protein